MLGLRWPRKTEIKSHNPGHYRQKHSSSQQFEFMSLLSPSGTTQARWSNTERHTYGARINREELSFSQQFQFMSLLSLSGTWHRRTRVIRGINREELSSSQRFEFMSLLLFSGLRHRRTRGWSNDKEECRFRLEHFEEIRLRYNSPAVAWACVIP